MSPQAFLAHLQSFSEFGSITEVRESPYLNGQGREQVVPVCINEFWTAGQRQAHPLHEISYRACFKPQLPRFFIQRLTRTGEVIYDPFMGRGTTLLEAALLGRRPAGNDINPLSRILIAPRLQPPTLEEVAQRLGKIPFDRPVPVREDLLVFYHPQTLGQICALREYLLDREGAGKLDAVDRWVRLIAVNRLTGHSPGFFSVYTLPPNQAVSIQSQQKINLRRKQVPPKRDVPSLMLKKSRKLLGQVSEETRQALVAAAGNSLLSTAPAWATPEIPSGSVSLVVTSPPFLNVVNYALDNWLRCWFTGIDPGSVKLTVPSNLEHWKKEMTRVLEELKRVLRPGGYVAFEVGEVRNASLKLEESVLECGAVAGLKPILVMINAQEFTKTANCWGVRNNSHGTNSNRIVLFQRFL